MEIFESIIKQFAQMRIQPANPQATVGDAWNKLTEVNAQFVLLRDEWLTMTDELQATHNGRYLQAQQDFHHSATAIISMLMPEPTVRFGEFTPEIEVICTAENTSVTFTTTAPAMNVDQSGQSSSEQQIKNTMQQSKPINNSSAEMELDNDNQVSTINVVHSNNNSNNSSEQSTIEMKNLSMISFAEQAKLLESILALPRSKELNENTIDTVIQAIQQTAQAANSAGVQLDQAVVRTMILHIVTSLDQQTQICWKYWVARSEPSFEFLVQFLYERKVDVNQPVTKDESTGYKIPKVSATKRASPKPEDSSQMASTSRRRSDSMSSRGSNPPKSKKKTSSQACPVCPYVHGLHACPTFRKLSLEQRETEVTKRNLCKNCFSNKHATPNCPKGECTICGKKHNSTLHHR